jgi:hypothetical protein
MKYILILILFISGLTANAQFPAGTDTLRNYNNRFIDNNATKAFTNLRLHNLIGGMLDHMDTISFGGSINLGMDTAFMSNDSLFVYRKGGVFHPFIIRGSSFAGGAGQIYRVPFSDGLGHFTNDSNFKFDKSVAADAARLIVGPISISSGGYAKINATSDNMNALALTSYGTGLNTIIARRARGTIASPTALQSGDDLFNISGRGYGDIAFSSSSRAAIYAQTTQNWTDSTQGTRLYFRTTSNDSAVAYDRMTITDSTQMQPVAAVTADSIAGWRGTGRLKTLLSIPIPTGGSGITQLTGDGTAGPGSGSQALTFATVNSNVGSFTNANITVNAKGLVTAASNGSGGGTLTQNVVGDSIGVGSMAIRVQNIANDNNNECYWCDVALSLPKSKLAHIRDTFAVVSDSTHFNIFIGPGTHSYGDDYSRYQMNIVNLLLPKYSFSGPGLFNGDMINYQFSPTNPWTQRTLLTTPKGRGIAGKSAMSTSSDLIVSSGANFAANSYNSYQDILISTYDTSTGGTMSVIVDGTPIDTINTSVGTGPTIHTYHLSSNTKHVLTLHEITASTTHCELLDIYLHVSNKRGIIVNKAACGSTDVSNWVAQNSSQAISMLQAIPGGVDLILSDLQVNNQNHNLDTNTCRIQQDTLIKRWRTAWPNVGIILMKGTQYGYDRWGTPTYTINSYSRQLDQLARTDSVATFDNDRIVGTFPKSLSIGTITNDSLHPQSQTFYTISADLFANIGGFVTDIGVIHPNIFEGPDSSHVVNPIGSQRVMNWDIHSWHNLGLNTFKMVNSTNNQFLTTDISSINQVNYTSQGGTSTQYSWDGSGHFAGPIFTNTTTALSQIKGKLYIGNGGGIDDLSIQNSTGNGYTIVGMEPTSSSNFSLLRFKDGAGTDKTWLISFASASSLSGAGTAYETNSTALTAIDGSLNIGTTSNNTFRIFSGGSATTNNRLSITGAGYLTGQNLTEWSLDSKENDGVFGTRKIHHVFSTTNNYTSQPMNLYTAIRNLADNSDSVIIGFRNYYSGSDHYTGLIATNGSKTSIVQAGISSVINSVTNGSQISYLSIDTSKALISSRDSIVIKGAIASAATDSVYAPGTYKSSDGSNNMLKVPRLPYKIYVATLTQSSTSAPTATVLENTLGGTVVWTRTGTGDYLATLSSAFTANKTIILTGPANDISGPFPATGYRASTSTVVIKSFQPSSISIGQFDLSDGLLTEYSIEIRVYP